MKFTIIFLIAMAFLTAGVGFIWSEIQFRRHAVLVAGRTIGFVRKNESWGNLWPRYCKEVRFLCPFTDKNRRVVSVFGQERQPELTKIEITNVYVSKNSPHIAKIASSSFFLMGGLFILIGLFWIIIPFIVNRN